MVLSEISIALKSFKTAAGAAGLAAAGTIASPRPAYGRRRSTAARKKVLVLGIDGMDPEFLSRLEREGHMPNFSRLMQAGSFRRLGTSNPPQSRAPPHRHPPA